jgi:hypothetical protein
MIRREDKRVGIPRCVAIQQQGKMEADADKQRQHNQKESNKQVSHKWYLFAQMFELSRSIALDLNLHRGFCLNASTFRTIQP